MKDYNQYKKLIMAVISGVNIGIHAALFAFVWFSFYTGKMKAPLYRGNWVMVLVFAVIYTLFAQVFGGLKVGYLRTIDVSFSQIIAVCFTGVITYLMITLVSREYMDVKPLLAMMAAEMILGTIWILISRKIYRKIYPPHQMVVVYGQYDYEDMLQKMESRHDKFNIRASINISEGLEKVKEVVLHYESVILYDLPARERNIILKHCFKHSIRVYLTPKISDIILSGTDTIHLFDTPLLLARNNGLNFQQRCIKRFMDLFFAIPMFIITLPFGIVFALMIHFYDGGPIFYKQERLTLGGKPFMIYKFRSMRQDSEEEGARLAMKDDDRITPIGSFLRKTHLDELPQVLNIIKGDMSMVGPRPEREEIANQYVESIPEFDYRLLMKAGLTGYAQIYGKYNTTPYDKLKLDLLYLENYSVFLDLKLILMTFKIIFQRENTEGVNADQTTAQKEK